MNGMNGDEKKRGREVASSGGNNVDLFLASMTFASASSLSANSDELTSGTRGVFCDCDECGYGESSFVPQAIVDAIRKHKRQKHESILKRTQHRVLLQRHSETGVAVYEWTLPLNSEPLVEFGTSHRLIWIRRLPSSSVLMTIGRGIVGSQQEEEGRRPLKSWKQGDILLVPSNGGKAVAWIHKTADNEIQPSAGNDEKSQSTATSGGHAILYICKIPVQEVNDNNETNIIDKPSTTGDDNNCSNDNPAQNETTSNHLLEWHEIVQHTCYKAMASFQNESTANASTIEYQKLPEESSVLLRDALSNLG